MLIDARVNLIHFQDMKETYWRQKVVSKHIMDGGKNTKYFHTFVNKKEPLIVFIRLKMIKALGVMIIKRLQTL